MSRVILDCLKGERDICIQNIILSQNTALKWTPALSQVAVKNRFQTRKIETNLFLASRADVLRLVTRSSPRSWGGTRDKPKNVCVGG